MAQTVVVDNEQYKRRNPIVVWLLLPLVTLGVYHFVWWYKINDEARRYLRDPSIRPALSVLAMVASFLVIPPFISVYRTAERVRRMQVAAGVATLCAPWLAIVLVFLLGTHIIYLQMELNSVWDVHLRSPGRRPASPPPVPPPLPPATG